MARCRRINSADQNVFPAPGRGPMLAFPSAWNTMAAELRYRRQPLTTRCGDRADRHRPGPAIVDVHAGHGRAVPGVTELPTAAQAEQADGQAFSAATAFSRVGVFCTTVPPPVVAANRAQLATLVATNVIGRLPGDRGHRGPLHTEMWAQDAAAMNGYASASSTATQLTPLTAPAVHHQPRRRGAQATAVAHATATPAASASSATSGATSSTTSGARHRQRRHRLG